MKRKNHLMFYLTLLICAIMPLGFASFDVLAGETSQATPTLDDDAVTKVCYNDTTNKQYTTIEMALKEANSGETIYVIPNPNGVSIYNDCVIKEGVTLNLPYSITYDSSTNTYSNPISFASTSGGVTTLSYNDNSRKSVLYLEEGVTLTNNGTLYVGGIQSGGNGGSYYSGHTQGSFSEINVKKNATIVSNGTITSYGYISGVTETNGETGEIYSTSNLIFSKTSLTEIPFIVVEHRGGTVFMGMAGENPDAITSLIMKLLNGDEQTYVEADLQTAPFNRFLLHNFLNVNYTFYSGAKVIAKADLYADNQNNKADVKLVGSNDNSYFISLADNACIKGWLNNDISKNSINFYGSFTLNSMSLSLYVYKTKFIITVKGYINLSTSQIHFPIPHYFDISLNRFLDGNEAVVDLTNQNIKLLPGSNLIINENVTVNANSIIVYENGDFYKDGAYYITGNVGCSFPYPQAEDANLICNGYLFADELGGHIKSTKVSANPLINIKSKNSVSSNEIYSTTDTTLTISGIDVQTYSAANYISITHTANGNLITGNDITNSNLLSSVNYKCDFINGTFVYYLYTITFNNVSNDNIDFTDYNIKYDMNFIASNLLGDICQPSIEKINENARDINFLGYYLDKSFTHSITNLNYEDIKTYISLDSSLTIYSRWEYTKNGITVIIKNTDGSNYDETYYNSSSAEISLPTDFSKKSIFEGNNGDTKITKKEYTFAGWSIENGTFESGTTIGVLNTANISSDPGNIVTISPLFLETSIDFYRLSISITFNSNGLGGDTSATISLGTCLSFDNNNMIYELTSASINYETNNSIFYLPENSIVKVSYSGYDGRIKDANITVKFSGFANGNDTIGPTKGSGSVQKQIGKTSATITIN